MMATKTEVVWEGAEALRPFLVPIDTLEPFPGNPRRGDVEAVRESLRANGGQLIPILVDGPRIVAGHARTEAALAEGYTHIAAIPHAFEDENQARRFLLADNGTHDRGGYDPQALLDQLKALQAVASLDGSGYADTHVSALERDLARAAGAATPPDAFPPLNPDDIHIDYQCPACGHGWSGHPRPGS